MSIKYPIELNGVANALVLLQIEADQNINGQIVMNEETFIAIHNNLLILERYMLAYSDAVNNGVTVPQWHEVRDNPTKYPSNRERHGG